MHLSCLPFLYVIYTLKSSRDGINVLDNFNVSSIKTANTTRRVIRRVWQISWIRSFVIGWLVLTPVQSVRTLISLFI